MKAGEEKDDHDEGEGVWMYEDLGSVFTNVENLRGKYEEVR
jgi:hypothetical protein